MSRAAKVAGAALAVLALAALAAYVLVPRIVRAKCEDAARAHGIDLTIGAVDVWVGSATFSEVDAKARDPKLPLAVHARQIVVTLDGLSPRDVEVRDARATLDGPLVDVAQAIEQARAAQAAAPPSEHVARAPLRRAAIKGAHARWTRALGAGTALDADGVDVTLALGEGERLDALDLVAPAVRIEGPVHGTLGPIRAEATYRAPDAAEVTVSDLSKRAVVRYALGAERVLDVDVARDKLSRYGFAALVPGKDPDVSVKLHAVAGQVTQGTFSYGPFKGTLTGTVAPEVPSAHLAYATDPVSCADIARQVGAQIAGPLGAIVGQIGGHVLEGEARATGEIVWDAREAGAARLSFAPSQNCAPGGME